MTVDCRTVGCTNRVDDAGDGWDGYCASCADRRDRPELLDLAALAREARVTVASMRVYRWASIAARAEGVDVKAGAKDALPFEDYSLGGSPVWLRSTVQPWLDARKRQPSA